MIEISAKKINRPGSMPEDFDVNILLYPFILN
jgi:hypothetical protein